MEIEIPRRIVKFIKKHHVFTLATTQNGQPWCSQCFYAYYPGKKALVFTSDLDTRHIREINENDKVAASIVLETKFIGKIRGVQIEGDVLLPDIDNMKKAKRLYLYKFPFALLKDTKIWLLSINTIKMTDNRLGFGKKLRWNR